MDRPLGRRTWVATTSAPAKICTMSPAVRACRRCPINRHGTEYSALPTLRCASTPTAPIDHVVSSKALGGNGDQRLGFGRLEHPQRLAALQRPRIPQPGDLAAPAHRVALHLGQRAELAASPERVPHIGHGSFHPGFVLGFERPRGVDQGAVVGGQLGVGPVDLRVIQVGFVHPGLEVVTHQPRRHPSNMRVSFVKAVAGSGLRQEAS